MKIIYLAFLFLFLLAPTTLAQEGLISHWKFDGNGNNEVSGGSAAVIVGNATFNQDDCKMGGYL